MLLLLSKSTSPSIQTSIVKPALGPCRDTSKRMSTSGALPSGKIRATIRSMCFSVRFPPPLPNVLAAAAGLVGAWRVNDERHDRAAAAAFAVVGDDNSSTKPRVHTTVQPKVVVFCKADAQFATASEEGSPPLAPPAVATAAPSGNSRTSVLALIGPTPIGPRSRLLAPLP